jgi:hypothetical protein
MAVDQPRSSWRHLAKRRRSSRRTETGRMSQHLVSMAIKFQRLIESD